MSRLALLLLALAVAGCVPRDVPVQPSPHYVVGEPYQAGGIWRYPREQFTYADAGLALVADRAAGLTADGEAFDQGVLAAAHRTLQLPVLARVTNLENGRAVLVRVNDRGPGNPGRLIAVTRRAAELLGASPSTPFQVRVQVMEAESRQLASGMAVAAPLQVAVAPRAGVKEETLAPPTGATSSGRGRVAAAFPSAPTAPQAAAPGSVPLRLPEQVWQMWAEPGVLYVECGTFARQEYAAIMRSRLADLGAHLSTDYNAPRDAAYRVRIGPLDDTAAADATLDRALRAGVSDARIVVDGR